ncbi:hypothetical protein PTSG_09518 [Salpingoeca rosetta]|uniref:RING-type E3 ubiquitin transferase n=1 Tax=Salpingoeca rosetta (strain ATCC 50818 / BSB-021) TaxID=946362 RepID=F2UL85_SALR5|nr:uncharacterized protein PTSG_09518 [Salpingoeca rosetta]EGD77884.1 hypothetical protein PTSG_09518 [Salpingoeca rosetta]|eukprot:XP_004989948.1 hypothetical protein PTSG_09518 [Salpingoeca rosetta]
MADADDGIRVSAAVADSAHRRRRRTRTRPVQGQETEEEGAEPVIVLDEDDDDDDDDDDAGDAADGNEGDAGDDNQTATDSEFSCNICLDAVSDPVVTRCGHLFCWPCLHEWLRRKPDCPVCKAGVTQDSVIPIYTASNKTDPRTKQHPPRPQAERAPPVQNTNPFGNFMNGMFGPGQANANFNAQFFVGVPPFGGFHMNVGGADLTPEQRRQQQAALQWFLLGLFILFLVLWL